MRTRELAISAVAVSVVAAVFGTWLHGVRHTLDHLPAWSSSKLDLERGAMGAVAYVTTPVALANERLNLGPWHGFQEVTTTATHEVTGLSARVWISPGGRLDVLYAVGEWGKLGVRLSRQETYSSRTFTARPGGGFEATEALSPPPLGDDPVALELSPEGSQLAIRLDGVAIGHAPMPPPGAHRLGFRGSLADVFVDDVVVQRADGSTWSERFEPTESRLLIIVGWFAALSLLFAILVRWLVRRRGSGRPIRPVTLVLAIAMTSLMVGGPLLLADRLLLQGFHGYSTVIYRAIKPFTGYATTIEAEDAAPARLARELGALEGAPGPRVLFVGSSQIWGAGLSTTGVDVVASASAALSAAGTPTTCFNAGVSGSRVARLHSYYQADWQAWRPDVIVLNLSNNDSDPEVFREGLEAFVSDGQAQGAEVLFALEANESSSTHPSTLPNHEVMRQVAAATGVPVVDMHAAMLADRETGLMWWDFVHLTDYGQRRAGEHFAAAISPLLRGRP